MNFLKILLIINVIFAQFNALDAYYQPWYDQCISSLKNNANTILYTSVGAMAVYSFLPQQKPTPTKTQLIADPNQPSVTQPQQEQADVKAAGIFEGLSEEELRFFIAVNNNHSSIVDFYIRKGIDINIVDKLGGTALSLAISNNNEIIAKKLIDAGAHINSFSGGLAVAHSNETILQMLIDARLDLNVQSATGHTMIMYAVDCGNVHALKQLIKAGANFNLQDNEGFTAIMFAMGQDKYEMTKILIEAGADLSIKDIEGKTVIDYAVLFRKEEMVKLLLESQSAN